MDKSLKLIDDKTLCLFDNDNKLIATHSARWTKFQEFKRVGKSCNIIKESNNGFNANSEYANIYCLDDSLQIVWTIESPFETDSFPNPICWNKQTEVKQGSNGYLTLEFIDNSNTFTCASQRGVTVTVDYYTGRIVLSEFTK